MGFCLFSQREMSQCCLCTPNKQLVAPQLSCAALRAVCGECLFMRHIVALMSQQHVVRTPAALETCGQRCGAVA